jgi:hypothetical protein
MPPRSEVPTGADHEALAGSMGGIGYFRQTGILGESLSQPLLRLTDPARVHGTGDEGHGTERQ